MREQRALHSGTVGAGASPLVVPPASYSLSLSGDLRLGGAVFKNGQSFLHEDGLGTALGRAALGSLTNGYFNTAVGEQALLDNTEGSKNTAVGTFALFRNEVGSYNTAVGHYALENSVGYSISSFNYSANTALGRSALGANTVGHYNTAVGANALRYNVKGTLNTAVGFRALYSSVGDSQVFAPGINYGRNTALGAYALVDATSGIDNTGVGSYTLGQLTTGSRNSALGFAAGYNLTGDDSSNVLLNSRGVAGDNHTLRIGKATGPGLEELNRAFIHGIRGIPVTGSTVVVSTGGQLGTIASSRRYKEEIQAMGDRSAGLLDLIPVTFRYKPDVAGKGERPLQYGLIAEEVAEVFPELVVFDDEGLPETVKYHLLSSMLLNELQRQHDEMAELRRRLEALEGL